MHAAHIKCKNEMILCTEINMTPVCVLKLKKDSASKSTWTDYSVFLTFPPSKSNGQKHIYVKRETETETESVCVCVCVCERERERERERFFSKPWDKTAIKCNNKP